MELNFPWEGIEMERKNRLRELREAYGLTGPELAEKVHLSPTYIYELERGKKRFNATTLKLFTDFFGVSTDYILGRNGEDQREQPKIFDPERCKTLGEALVKLAETIYLTNMPEKMQYQLFRTLVKRFGRPEGKGIAAESKDKEGGSGVFDADDLS